ncbi:MAG TPA: LamG domain-containing protein, partial [Candidatus Saccharimonadales bacterium]|nr:LamG domain-containing protein [Candidatus Saccharimonadales bacterium]
MRTVNALGSSSTCKTGILPMLVASIVALLAAIFAPHSQAAGGYADAVLADGPIAYWRFNDSPPTAVNSGSLGAAANGTYNGGATAGTEAPRPPAFVGFDDNNTALQCNGTDAFVSAVTGLMNSRPVFTVSGWMRRNADQPNRTGLWGQNDLLEFGYINNTTLEVWTDNGLDLTPAPIPNGEWAHLTFVSEGSPGTLSLYTNGSLALTRQHSLPANNSFAWNMGGGGVFDGTGNFFNGQIDEVAIFDKALTAAQVSAQYHGAFVPTRQFDKFVNVGGNAIGTVTADHETYTIVGGGNDIWDMGDEFSYAYTTR